ncbi:hypothetical protein [Kordia sp.]|uniref:hypothetical protein n=1 Tax=Kordia sp. TaxID=1965332 RepID=UPI003B5A349D
MKKKNLKNLTLNKRPISKLDKGQIKGGTNMTPCRIKVPLPRHTDVYKCSVVYCPDTNSHVQCS